MTITKYPQSHLVVLGDSGERIVIDPGYITFQQGYSASEFKGADGYLITHIHNDHMGWETIREVVGDKLVYGNSDVVGKLGELGVEGIKIGDREKLKIGNMVVEAVNLPHCKMQDGSDGPPNTGFLIQGIFFHPGDGDIAPEKLQSSNVALPIAGPTITTQKALKFAKDVRAKVVIPIHYDYFTNNPEEFKKLAAASGIEVHVLKSGEEITIDSV